MDILRHLGAYALVRKIASGGMAEVWMGRRRAMGGASKTVAIKLLAAHLAENPVYRRMFVDEARLTMMLTHSNIVAVFDVGEQAGRSYLVMEWVDGLDLSRLAAGMRAATPAEPFSLTVVAHIIGEVLRGLAYAHGLRDGEACSTVVHRDISPHNVLLSVSGEVKVSDFGVARLASEETSGLHVRGKLRYMPPEQIRGESRAPTIDLFAVGAMMQELLDGCRFRADLEREDLFAMVIEGRVPPLRREVPAELRALRDGLLCPDRNHRIQSAEEALALLRRWPGYRNAADEVTALVRRWHGVEAPRTGLTVAFSGDSLVGLEEPTTIEGEARLGSSELETRTVIEDSDQQGSDTTPSVGVDRSAPPRSRRLPLSLALGLAGVGALLGFGFGWFPGTGPSNAGAGAALATAPPVVVADRIEAEAPPTSVEAEPVLAAAVEAETEPSPAAAETEPETEPETERPRSRKPTANKPAEVEFAAHEFFFVWIKVRGRSYALEPVATLSLPPGRHAIALRESADEPWRDAGRITVAAGGHYKVALRKPAKLSLEKQE